MKYQAHSAIIGRKPREEGKEYKTLFVKLFDVLDPEKDMAFPIKELDFPNTMRVIFKNIPPLYYLEGNDLIYKKIAEIDIEVDGVEITITAS